MYQPATALFPDALLSFHLQHEREVSIHSIHIQAENDVFLVIASHGMELTVAFAITIWCCPSSSVASRRAWQQF